MPWGGHSPKDAQLVISPASGPAAGGTGVTITPYGTQQADFHGTVRVTFDGVNATSIHAGNNKLTCDTPAHAVQSGCVVALFDDANAEADVSGGYSYV